MLGLQKSATTFSIVLTTIPIQQGHKPMKKFAFLAAVAGISSVALADTTVFSDDFGTNSSANYAVVIAGEATAQFGFDATGLQAGGITLADIPSAPGQTGENVLRFEANPTSGARSGVTVFPNVTIPAATDFRVTLYAFQRVNPSGIDFTGGSGSSQDLVIAINTDGTKVISQQQGLGNLPNALTGYFFGVVGDAGFGNPSSNTSNGNYKLVEGNPAGISTPTTQAVTWTYGTGNASGADIFGGLHGGGGFQALLGPTNGYNYFGGVGEGPGDKWTKYTVTWTASSATMSVAMNDVVVATYTDPDATFNAGGKVGVGIYDPTNSTAGAGNGYTLIDGLLVETIAAPPVSSAENWAVYQ
ncbi:MAG: hypothetical protein SFY68_06860 [Candidatus Sumerlaeia bacterium]|nr:hypothetical protein [Candidatus Sumerlaeia bacterium]